MDLEQILNLTLDRVITKRRDHWQLRLATNGEWAALPSGLLAGQAKGPIDPWLPLLIAEGSEHAIHLLCCRYGCPYITSPVVALSGDTVQTRSGSLYELGSRGQEVPYDLVRHVCAALWSWGLGRPLGVPFIYY